MARRHDAVLAAIPILAAGGPLAARLVTLTERAVGVGGRLAAVPFTLLGLVAAMSVIGHELLVAPPGG